MYWVKVGIIFFIVCVVWYFLIQYFADKTNIEMDP